MDQRRYMIKDLFEINDNNHILNDSKQFENFYQLLHAEKLMLNLMQFNNNRRSFSNPNIYCCDDNNKEDYNDNNANNNNDNDINQIVSENFHNFRQFLIQKNFQLISKKNEKSNECDNVCDIQTNANKQMAKPTPLPRRRRNKQQLIQQQHSYDLNLYHSIDDNDDNYKEIDLKIGNQNSSYLIHKNVDDSDHLSIKTSNSCPTEISDSSDDKTIFIQKSFEQLVRLPQRFPEIPIKTPTKMVKTNKNSFRSFLMIDKLKTNKFLSLRSKNKNRKSLSMNHCPSFNDNRKDNHQLTRSKRSSGFKVPTRIPPPPPGVNFRPPPPLPGEMIVERRHNEQLSATVDDTMSELYHDSANLYKIEEIYCSVDDEPIDEINTMVKCVEKIQINSIVNESKKNFRKNANTNSLSDDDDHDDEYDDEDEDNICNNNDNNYYYKDDLCIYEELSSGDGTIYEPYGQDDDDDDHDFIYDNVEDNNNNCKQENESSTITIKNLF